MVSEDAINEVIVAVAVYICIMRNNRRIARRIARRANWLLPEAARSKTRIAAGHGVTLAQANEQSGGWRQRQR